MSKDDFLSFFVDLLLIEDEQIIQAKISELYNASYRVGGTAFEERVFERINGLFEEVEYVLNEHYKDACEHYGLDLGDPYTDAYTAILTEEYKLILFESHSSRITKKITHHLLKKVRKRLKKALFKLRKETVDATIYETFANVPIAENGNVIQDFSELFLNPDDEPVCVMALYTIRPERPVISIETGRWQKRDGAKAVLAAWIRRMEDCDKIQFIRPIWRLVPLLEKRFPGLNLGKAGRTLSDPDQNIVEEFTHLILR
ncbi:hypothetical protein GCM10028805_27430 [Spirosoma harenae]